MTADDHDPQRPLLRVVNADAADEEVAAIVAVFSSLGAPVAAKKKPPAMWNNPFRQIRPFYSHGPGGWRASGLPKHRGRGN